ncbi:MAG: transglutaminase family protein [bacterium]|nr:transglutaminase family protein [bacterium]
MLASIGQSVTAVYLPFDDLGNAHRIAFITHYEKKPDKQQGFIEIEDIALDNIFPSRYNRYTTSPVGKVRLKKGDCDDLSVLYAACLESAGIPTALVSVPGHIFVIFDTGVQEKNVMAISFEPSKMIIRNNHSCLPFILLYGVVW